MKIAGAILLFLSSFFAKQSVVSIPAKPPDYPLSIAAMRQKTYPGSAMTIETTLTPGNNYRQYIASYLSDGLKIYGLLTVPVGDKPVNGWPVIIFNHGYIPPDQYRTTERYVAYVDAFARNGYIVFKPDYRGNGISQGRPEGAYYSPAYTVDVLNALASLKKYPGADPAKIGMWGHSMGGNITLRSLVVKPRDIKAAVIWGGVVGSYYDLTNNWHRRVPFQPSSRELTLRNSGRQQLISMYGPPATTSAFWKAIDPTAHLSDITAPIQLHTGGADEEVPVVFSQNLYASLQKAGKVAEYYNYPGGDHNIASPDFEQAMQRSVAFFDRFLKK
jgi:dipeptidyl aminopeptidase/acylaminoacyl peptidase